VEDIIRSEENLRNTKRHRAAALHNLADGEAGSNCATASWSAAALCRFPPRREKQQTFLKISSRLSFVVMEPRTPWPHAPLHQLSQRGTYFLTAGTYLKAHHFRSRQRLRVLHRGLLTVARDFGWRLEAWAVFSNHYHCDAPDATNLSDMLRLLHTKTTSWIHGLDQTPRRHVWYNFRETRLTYQKSYLARLNYVHQNPVRHGLVPVANQYPWCSAAWFERTASPAIVKSIYRFKVDQLNLDDEFEPDCEW
jgi:putative transposase